jgi:hypothetical protein
MMAGPGTVTGPLSGYPGWWHVTWDTGYSNVYRYGVNGAYDLVVLSASEIVRGNAKCA